MTWIEIATWINCGIAIALALGVVYYARGTRRAQQRAEAALARAKSARQAVRASAAYEGRRR